MTCLTRLQSGAGVRDGVPSGNNSQMTYRGAPGTTAIKRRDLPEIALGQAAWTVGLRAGDDRPLEPIAPHPSLRSRPRSPRVWNALATTNAATCEPCAWPAFWSYWKCWP